MPSPFAPVAPGVLVATSRRMQTTTTLVVHGDRGLLVDPAWLPDELEAIADDLTALGIRVTSGLSTHPHHDHLLWHPRFGDGHRWASSRAVEVVREHADELRAELTDPFPPGVLRLFGRLEPLPGADAVGDVAEIPDPFSTDLTSDPLLAITHDAHAPGHTALWAPHRGVLVVGDMLSDVELPLPATGLDAYLAGLDVLAPYVGRASVLVPGHGTPTADPGARLDADRHYLEAVLAGRTPDDPRLANEGMRDEHARTVAMVG
ncbi:MBL fold metallo-hydrolase [Actinotalea sp. M2MS4P-6]|uniref:MBL fold metallo-hydrolase n=1 Tax=Actinotalea sp. M2MS4P-6 TaxID=2983762 RepID=UPI0021E35B8B|nr:MBL fold metallo-hydrolase [Actinotalea sp. M2MS4P-6]MCV2393615.1 MBL fold metallo-hydrolase [Actinotalea sp. M2MS4P-6]